MRHVLRRLHPDGKKIAIYTVARAKYSTFQAAGKCIVWKADQAVPNSRSRPLGDCWPYRMRAGKSKLSVGTIRTCSPKQRGARRENWKIKNSAGSSALPDRLVDRRWR